MTVIKFHNSLAQAWFRSCLHRAAVKAGSIAEETELLWIRSKSQDNEARLSDRQTKTALLACEDMVSRGHDESFFEARQDIVDQLRAGADKEGLS